ncbi:hypothetical protein C8R45DRAFT_979321 [Mycena sanguinolenta]|nr:hypothetical protein C8R45DRAFT_979321 [Mycena sanguinolenta]
MDVDQTSSFDRAAELWFEDGNLVVQAENSQFRVYRGVLAAKSPIFCDMLSFPQPSDSEIIEGCPLVRLPDSATEVNAFLRALFDSEFFEAYPAPTKIEFVIGILRLSHKYEVNYLRRRALVHLSSGFPADLPEVDRLGADTLRPSWGITSTLPLTADIPPPPDLWISIIQLAREVDALWILPDAFYQLANVCSSGRDILASIKPAVFNRRSAQLSEADQTGFMNGYCAQINIGASDVMRFLHEPSLIEGCLCPENCMSIRLDAIDMVRHNRTFPKYKADPLMLWCEADDDWSRVSDSCDICIEAMKRTHRDARQAFWDQLPQMYGLPAWDELKKMKSAASRP